jgi:hypothetical protein
MISTTWWVGIDQDVSIAASGILCLLLLLLCTLGYKTAV